MYTRGLHTGADALPSFLKTRWLLALFLTVAIVLGLMTPPFDDAAILKRFFFDSACIAENAQDCWLISRANDEATYLLHTLPNRQFVNFGLAALFMVISAYWHKEMKPLVLPLTVFVVSLALCPAVTALLKQVTHHYCPNQLEAFRGMRLPTAKPHCYPAAHPAAGFSLLALAFAPIGKAWRISGAALGIILGSALAWVQMARGEHALSHVLATLAIALFIGYSIRCVIISRRLSQS